MEIKFDQTNINVFSAKNISLGGLVWFFLLVTFMNTVKIANAEPFIRVQRDGVIYYYFSSKDDKFTALNKGSSGHLRANRPQHKRISAQELDPWINWASQQHDLPASLIKAVIRVESNFNPGATSPKGAQGLMQLMPGTAEQLQVTDAYDIKENIGGGTRYLGMLLQKFNNNLVLALAAYNAGPHRVERHQGIPPIKETQGFVRDVCANFLQYSAPPCPPQ
jgi:hypothetical protein